MKTFAFALSLVFSASALSAQSYSLYEGESAKKLFESLSGSSVVSTGSTRTLNLGQRDGTLLVCNETRCSIENSTYSPTRDTDNDTLLQVEGSDADTLTASIPSLPKSGYMNFGYVGQYGISYLSCKIESQKKTCTFGISYCYQPGC